jgi:non-specific serine/threonine protein kinase
MIARMKGVAITEHAAMLPVRSCQILIDGQSVQKFTDMTDITVGLTNATAAPIVHLDALPVGTRLGEFEIQSLLGVGGFGMVYRAYDHSLHRTVAIKEYMPAALTSRQHGLSVSIRSSLDQQSYLNGLESFVAEARLLARFDHPSLVKVYRFWEANNTAYMAMPLYSGMTLKQARSQMSAPPSEAWLRTMLWSVLQALQLLHDNNMVHRDVSPDNIFLQDVGPPVLLDLGAARRAIAERGQKLTAILKVNYAPIEQYAEADDLQQGPWTDLYSLAAVIYTCLCNEPPLPATSRVVRDKLTPLSSVVQTIWDHLGQSYSEEFVSTNWHALAIQPADRPASVKQFIDEMKLESVKDLARFDWRAALGSQLLTQKEALADPMAQTREMTSEPALEPTQDLTQVDSEQTKTLPMEPAQTENRSLPARRLLWTVGAKVVLVGVTVLLLLLLLLLSTGVLEIPSLVAEPEPAAMPAQALSPQLPASEASLAEPPSDPAGEPVLSPDAPTSAAPVLVAPKVVASAAPAGKRRELASNQPPKPVKPVVKPAQPKVAPKELCAETNFVLRPMCIHLECRKAKNVDLAVCVDDRKRYPDLNQPSRP